MRFPLLGSAKSYLTQGKVILANLIGDLTILRAMRSNEIDTNTAYEFAKKHGMEYFEVSSKSGKNVNETIYELCKKIKNGMDNEIIVKHSEKKKIVNNKVMVEKKSFFSRCLI